MKRMLRLAGLLLVMLVSLARAQNDMNLQGLLGALMGANNSTQNVGVINHREIKAALPSDVAGMKRIKVSSSKQGAMGMTVSQAEAQYSSGREDEYVSIKVTDLGGMGQLGALGMASWATADIDQESDDGFERTVKIAGFKALEKFSKEGTPPRLTLWWVPV
jgi:hypothetical protein